MLEIRRLFIAFLFETTPSGLFAYMHMHSFFKKTASWHINQTGSHWRAIWA
jgi:hypothetical protein